MSAKTIARYGLLTAMMLMLGLVERQFVLFPAIPYIRLGLSNSVLIYAVCLMGGKNAWLLMLLKVLLAMALYAGPIGMLYALAGGALSVTAMLLLVRVKGLGMAGISAAGGAMHMIGQVLMSRVLLGTWAAAVQLPWLLIAGVVTGVLTGIVAQSVSLALAHTQPDIRKRLRRMGLTSDGDGDRRGGQPRG